MDVYCRSSYSFALLLLVVFIQDFTESLRLTEVRIPNHVIRNNSVRLECHFDMNGEALYSVKWYKDGCEFYRYVPRDHPPAQVFELNGVNVDLHNSTDTQVVLDNVNLASTGRYRCEVSAEAPSFQTVSDHGDMVVVGGRARYQIGDVVRLNCTSGRSKPAAHLQWFINGEPADSMLTRQYETIITGREGLETTILGLEFRVRQRHFKKGDMKLKCLATIASIYWKSNEESVEGDRPLRTPISSPIESRSVPSTSSKADRVQASNSSKKPSIIFFESILIKSLLLIISSAVFR
ncbi:CLUMA_CG015870, isoform A [Clunio marinus]|uniref:CLUMA_CG015870, isoform A n=1 Tax=Clunio marinus TaxID=568069 RepID=A0A1J1IRC2_9DIPT|nr:CLUMA_CG015870, isoform A [Clunio marinus]